MNPNVKEITKKDPKAVCQYCHSSYISPMQWGPMYQLEGITVHYFCLLFSAGLNQVGEDDEGIFGFMPRDIRKEIKRGDRLKCKFCRRPNATIGCWNRSCNFSYHFPCGLRNNCSFQFIDNFSSFCSKHKEPLEVPPSVEDDRCPICLLDIDSKQDIALWPPCCKKESLIHKRCLMEMGRNHGIHYFKCPLCNNKDVFSVAMRKMGIFLPDRDAAWETVPNAFVEQTERYRRCDADTCQCPKGRDHSSKSDSKPWKIIRCGGCGASAIHKYCGKLKNLTWRCVTCAAVLLDKKKSGELNSAVRIQREEFPTPSSSTTTTNSDEPDRPSTSRKAGDEDSNDEDASSGSTPIPPSSSSVASVASDSTDISSARESFFDPRYGMNFAVDPEPDEDTESTEDEVDEDDDNIFISPESKLHQQLFGGPPRPIDSTAALRRCTEKVKYPDPVLPAAIGTPAQGIPDPLFASASPLLLAQYIPRPPLSTSSQTSQSESISSTTTDGSTPSSASHARSAQASVSVQDTPDDSTSSQSHPDSASSSAETFHTASEPGPMASELTPPHTPSTPMTMNMETDKLQDIENQKPEELAGMKKMSSEAVPNFESPNEIMSEEEDDDMDICILECFSLAQAPGSGSGFAEVVKVKEEKDKDNDKTLPSSAPDRTDPENKLNGDNSAKDVSTNDDVEIKIVKVHETVWPTVEIDDALADSDAEQSGDDNDKEEDSGSDTDRVEDLAADDNDDGSDIQPIPEEIAVNDNVGGSDSDSEIEFLVEKPPSPRPPEAPNKRAAILDLVTKKVQGNQNQFAASAASAQPPPVVARQGQVSNGQQNDFMTYLEMVENVKKKMHNKMSGIGRAGPAPVGGSNQAAEPEMICLDSDGDDEPGDKSSTVPSNNPEQSQGQSGKRKRNEVED